MECEYEKNRQKKWGWRVSGITLIQNSAREKNTLPWKFSVFRSWKKQKIFPVKIYEILLVKTLDYPR